MIAHLVISPHQIKTMLFFFLKEGCKAPEKI